MAKSHLKMDSHILLEEQETVEIWYEGQFVASVYGGEGPGLRIMSKHPMEVVEGGLDNVVGVIEIRVDLSKP